MPKGEWIKAAAELAGLSQTDMHQAFRAVVKVICQNLSRGKSVQLLGFGTFEVRNRKARWGSPILEIPWKFPATIIRHTVAASS